jgi:O-antigen/teichoic acid export membrane protein
MNNGAPAAPAGVPEDLSGRSRLVRNVFSSWLAQGVLIALGFVMPRVIDQQVGQVALGIWDFCWSIVNYLAISGLYVGSSVNRYVARLRGEANAPRLNELVASVVCIQIGAAVVVAVGAALLVWLLPRVFAERLGGETEVAMWIVGFLGASLAVQMLFDSSRGIITGCHRWDIHNALNVGTQFIASVGMIVAIIFGFGLKGMVVIYFVATCVMEWLRLRISRRVCPELRLDLRLATKSRAKEVLRFGFKSAVIHIPNLLTIQTASVVVLSVLGPAVLAVFARPFAIIRHTGTFVDKFSAVLTPTASFLQGTASTDDLKKFFLSSTRFSVALTLPIVLILAVNGDWVMRIWMGEGYVNRSLISTLALLHFLIISQSSVMHVMIGLNAHGRIGGTALVVTVLGLAVGIITGTQVGWTLLSAAILVVTPLALSKGVIMPWMSCRRLGIPVAEYLRFCFAKPLAVGAVFGLCLWLGRQAPDRYQLLGIGVSACLGGTWTIFAYWRYLLTPDNRERLLERVGRHKGKAAANR